MRATLLILLATLAVASATVTSVSTDKTEYEVGESVEVSWTYDVIPEGFYSLSAMVAYQSNGNDAPIGQASFLEMESGKTTISTDKGAFSSDQYFVLLRLVHTMGNFTELQTDYITFLRRGDDSGDLGRPGANEQGRPNDPVGVSSAGSRLKPWFM